MQSLLNGARALPPKDPFPWPDQMIASIQQAAIESNAVGEGNATLARARGLLWSDLEQGVKDIGGALAFGAGSIVALVAIGFGVFLLANMKSDG